MKRYGNLFEQIIEPENIYMAYRKARKGKGWQYTIKDFEASLETNLEDIRLALQNKTFTTSSYQTFIIHEPKERIIYKLPFNPDRIVQHAMMNIIEPIWEKLFIYDSYSCRKGKGIHAGSRRTMDFIRNVGESGYCLKMDISKFYYSIHHDTLYDIVQHKIKCPDTLWLLRDIIYSIPGRVNIPIGNYASQWLGNLYLNELDQILKHQYKVRFYVRYCDDFILLHTNKKWLGEMADVIVSFLETQLKLRVSRKALFPVKQGIDFLGYRHFPKYVLLRKSTVKRIKKRLRQLPDLVKNGTITISQARSSIASTEGWLMWCNAYNLRQTLKLDQLKMLCNNG